jgi:hypothetical protein
VLFGCSLFWIYEKSERSSAGPHGLRRPFVQKYFAAHRRAHCGLSGVAWLALILINMTHYYGSVVPEDLDLYLFETPFGTVSFLRLALLAIAVVMMQLLMSVRPM